MDATESSIKASQALPMVIAGGGPVGLSLALGLVKQGYEVCLVDPTEPQQALSESFDGRMLALSASSIELFRQVGVWDALKACCTPIKHIHVSQKGYLGLTLIHAEELGLAALGYAIRAADLGRVLWQAVLAEPVIQGYYQARVIDAQVEGDQGLAVAIETPAGSKTISAQMLIGADGTESKVRELMGVAFEKTHYQAWAFLAQATSRESHQGWAYERFTQQGPVALLPIDSHDHKLVYVVPDVEKARVAALDDEAFLAEFYQQMGVRMGGFSRVSSRMAYPLTEGRTAQLVKGRMLLMGNACHTQHPVAAQGLNLGLRDVSDFLAMSADHRLSASALAHYESIRLADHQQVMRLTDGLIRVFQHSSPLVGHLRGLGLMALQALPPLKKRLAKFASRGREAVKVNGRA